MQRPPSVNVTQDGDLAAMKLIQFSSRGGADTPGPALPLPGTGASVLRSLSSGSSGSGTDFGAASPFAGATAPPLGPGAVSGTRGLTLPFGSDTSPTSMDIPGGDVATAASAGIRKAKSFGYGTAPSPCSGAGGAEEQVLMTMFSHQAALERPPASVTTSFPASATGTAAALRASTPPRVPRTTPSGSSSPQPPSPLSARSAVTAPREAVLSELLAVDINSITPLQAMLLLAQWQARLK